MLGLIVIFQLSFIAGSQAGAGLRFPSDPTAYAVFKGWNAVTNGTLTFHFKTHKENGFLLYEDDKGQCEFFYLSLADGRLRMRLSMEKCREIQTFLVGHKLADGNWHRVTVKRHFHRTTVTVDDRASNSTYFKGPAEGFLGVKSNLYVGRIPWYTPLNELSLPAIYYESINDNRFIGCISGIMHSKGGKPVKAAQLLNTSGTVNDCSDPCFESSKCKNGGLCRGKAIGVWCDCRATGYEGVDCTTVASSVFLDGSGYIVYQPSSTEDIWSTVQSGVAFRVWTNTSHGLLLDLQLRSHGDYMLIELVDGKILVKIVLKEDEVRLSSGVHVNDKRWHWVEFKRQEHESTLTINRNLVAKKYAPEFKGLVQDVYFGGGPRKVLIKTESKRNFSGFLQEFYFGDVKILDKVASESTDKRFAKLGVVAVGVFPNGGGQIIPVGSGSGSRCSELADDEDGECEDRTTARAIEENRTTSASIPPEPVPTGVQAQRLLPQAVPIWIIFALGAVSFLAILITICFLYRWNARYSGSFKPEPCSSTVDSSKHDTLATGPRICVTTHEDKV